VGAAQARQRTRRLVGGLVALVVAVVLIYLEIQRKAERQEAWRAWPRMRQSHERARESASEAESRKAHRPAVGAEGIAQAREELEDLLLEFPQDDRALHDALAGWLADGFDPCPDGPTSSRAWREDPAKRL
jgi:cell division septation protein DedD